MGNGMKICCICSFLVDVAFRVSANLLIFFEHRTMFSALLSEVSIRTIALFLVVFLTLLVFFKRRKNLPPSPSGSWPVVGHLLSLGRAPHLKLTEWRKQYGEVYTVRMGMEDVVVLNGYRAIKEALVDYKDAFSSRPSVYVLNLISGFGKSAYVLLFKFQTCMVLK